MTVVQSWELSEEGDLSVLKEPPNNGEGYNNKNKRKLNHKNCLINNVGTGKNLCYKREALYLKMREGDKQQWS